MMDDLEMILPESWRETLPNKEKITDNDAILFGKENLLYLINDFEEFLSFRKSSMTDQVKDHFIKAILKMRALHYEAESRPIFPSYRNYHYFKEGDTVFIFEQNNFHQCTVLVVEENVGNLQVEPQWNNFDFGMLARLPLIKSPCMLSQTDFSFMIANKDYAKIWFEIGYRSMPIFNKETLLSVLSRYK